MKYHCIGNEIRYVDGSFVAGTSAASPGVPRHICTMYNMLVITSFVRPIMKSNSLFTFPPQALMHFMY